MLRACKQANADAGRNLVAHGFEGQANLHVDGALLRQRAVHCRHQLRAGSFRLAAHHIAHRALILTFEHRRHHMAARAGFLINRAAAAAFAVVGVLDNYDSFTYNLLHVVKELGATDIEVVRNDQIELDEVDRFDKIILSPGPGIPEEAGLLLPIIKRYAPTKSILGVCLGHQAIGEAFGARLENLKEVYHGVQTPVSIIRQDLLFEGLGKEIPVGRYHSWVVSREGFPDCLEITAESQEGQIMAIRHKTYNVHGIQFHPESVLTPQGKEIIKNFLND